MGESGASRAIGVGQVAGIVAFTLALFFVIAFATKSVEAYRLRSWRDRLQGEIDEMHRRRQELEEEITRRQSMSWVDEALRDAGWVAEGVVAVIAIPATILITLAGMHAFHMSFNLMTLGGIAAAIGLIIDDAIVVVEAMHAKVCAGHPPRHAVHLAIKEVGLPLVGSTLTPVVVFIPLAYLDGVPGVFFRALAEYHAHVKLIFFLLFFRHLITRE